MWPVASRSWHRDFIAMIVHILKPWAEIDPFSSKWLFIRVFHYHKKKSDQERWFTQRGMRANLRVQSRSMSYGMKRGWEGKWEGNKVGQQNLSRMGWQQRCEVGLHVSAGDNLDTWHSSSLKCRHKGCGWENSYWGEIYGYLGAMPWQAVFLKVCRPVPSVSCLLLAVVKRKYLRPNFIFLNMFRINRFKLAEDPLAARPSSKRKAMGQFVF